MIKATITAIILTVIFSIPLHAQKPVYEISRDAKDGSKVLKGIITRSDIENDTAFAWFDENMKLGRPDVNAVAAFKAHAGQFQVIIFGGTWCEDTQNLLPVFYKLADAGNLADSNITLIGVDRAKTTLYDLHKVFGITNVPTFIVMHQGKEVGRVEEYGKYGQIDKELGEIVATIQ